MALKVQRQLLKRLSVSDAPTLGNTATLASINLGPGGTGAAAPAFSPFNWIVLSIVSNQGSAANGVFVDASFDDGQNFDVVGASTYAGGTTFYKFKKHLVEGAQYRLRWTGNGTTPTTFRGAVYLSNEETED